MMAYKLSLSSTWYLIFALVLCCKRYFTKKHAEKKLPPGPKPIMIFGNLPHLFFHPDFPDMPTVLKDLAKKWGNVMRIKIGNREAVVFSSLNGAKYILNHEHAFLRAKDGSMERRGLNKNMGINFSNGACWKFMREYTLRKFRHFGIGKPATDNIIFEEAAHLVRIWDRNPVSSKQIVPIDFMFDVTAFNVIWRQITGQRFELWDPQVNAMLHASNRFLRSTNLGVNLHDAFPYIASQYLLPGGLSPEEQSACLDIVHEFCREVLNSHKQSNRAGGRCKSFVDDIAENVLQNKGAQYSCFADEGQFVVTLLDIFQNAVDSITGALTFAILNVTRFPHVKNAIFEEIQLEFSDISWDSISIRHAQQRLPYTHAFIYETLRYSKLVPIISPREAAQDIKMDNYVIPKGTLLLVNLQALNDSPDDWVEPGKFMPERFLNSDGCCLDHSKTSRLLSFGSGVRKCIGEEVGLKSIFTIFIVIMKAYDFFPSGDLPQPDDKLELGLNYLPKSFSVLMTPRK